MKIKRFWIPDNFIREHARDLKPSAHSVYMSLCSHANRNGVTFISYRRMAKELGLSKTTVKSAVDELIAYQLLVRLKQKIGRASQLKVLPVPENNTKQYQKLVPKEYNKELFKEEKRFLKNNKPEAIGEIIKRDNPALEEMRKKWGRKI